MTQTLEVTDVDETLLSLLDKRASQQSQDRSAYVRDLLRRDLTKVPARAEASAAGKAFAEVLAPIHESVKQSRMTPEEVDALLDETLADVRRERRKRQAADNGISQ